MKAIDLLTDPLEGVWGCLCSAKHLLGGGGGGSVRIGVPQHGFQDFTISNFMPLPKFEAMTLSQVSF